MARLARKALADQRAMEEQNERTNPLDGRGATPSMGLSQVRGGRRKKVELEAMADMEGGIVAGDEVGNPFSRGAFLQGNQLMEGGIVAGDEVGNPFSRGAFLQGNQLMEHLHKLHGKGYARSFHEGMKGGLGTGRYEGKGFWDDFKKGFNMVFEPAAKVLKIGSTLLGQPEIAAGLSAIGYGKMDRMAQQMMGAGKITKTEMDALKSVMDRHRGGMCGGLDWKKILQMSMPLAEQLLGMGLPKKHYNAFQKVMKALQQKEMKGGMSLERKVGGAKHKKEMEACESDSEDEMAGSGEMPPLYAMKRKNFPVNRGAGASDGRKKRAEIVKKVMADKGLSMINASKYVKANNLY